MWCDVKWSEVKWSEVKWSEVKWSDSDSMCHDDPPFGACPKSSNFSNSYNIFSLIVILFINFLTKVSMYE